MKLTRRGVPRYRLRLPKSFICHLLTTDGKQEIEVPVEVYVDDWGENSIDCVMLHGWDIEGLLSEDESDQVYTAIAEHYTEMCERMADYEDERGDWLRDQRKDYLAESRGE